MTMLKVPEYEKLLELRVRRSVCAAEIQHLSWLGSQVPKNAVIVEIGSYRGISALAMALGARSANKTFTLYAIDPWQKGVGKIGITYSGAEVFPCFVKNITAFGLIGQIIPIMAFSQVAFRFLHDPIDLLFIDGGHRFSDVNFDYTRWSRKVVNGGKIAFHDYSSRFPGIDKVVANAIASGDWDNINIIDSIWSATKKGEWVAL